MILALSFCSVEGAGAYFKGCFTQNAKEGTVSRPCLVSLWTKDSN